MDNLLLKDLLVNFVQRDGSYIAVAPMNKILYKYSNINYFFRDLGFLKAADNQETLEENIRHVDLLFYEMDQIKNINFSDFEFDPNIMDQLLSLESLIFVLSGLPTHIEILNHLDKKTVHYKNIVGDHATSCLSDALIFLENKL